MDKNLVNEEVEPNSGSLEKGAEAVAVAGLFGRALDAAVAELVMEWSNVRYDFAGLAGVKPNRGYGDDIEAVPELSSEIAAAMQVVEKMRGSGWSFACTMYEGKLPYASFCRGTAASSSNAEAATLPEAICRAALLALASAAETSSNGGEAHAVDRPSPAFDHPFEPNRQCSGLTCDICDNNKEWHDKRDESLRRRRAIMPDYDKRLEDWLS